MSLYLDASALLPLIVTENASKAIDRFMEELPEPPLVSEFAAGEVSSALSRLIRTKQLEAADVRARLSDFDAWRVSAAIAVEVEAVDVRLATIFVRRFELALRMPDALHCAICHRLGNSLVTLDMRLAGAAAALGIPIVVPQ